MEYKQIGKKCPNCNTDSWILVDNIGAYCEICAYMNTIEKDSYLRNFQCSECNCFY